MKYAEILAVGIVMVKLMKHPLKHPTVGMAMVKPMKHPEAVSN